MDIFETWLVNKYIADGGLIDNNNFENTLPAYQNAVENDYAVLLDVQGLSDGTIICYKESILKTNTNKNAYVSNLTSIDINDTKLKDGNIIPTFEQALETINGKVPVLINIVNNTCANKLESAVCKILKSYKGEFAICSSNPTTIKYLNEQHPNIVCGIKVEDFTEKLDGSFKTKCLKKLKYNKFCSPQFILYYHSGLPNRFVKKYKELPLIATDVNNQEQYLKLIKHCDNITFYGFKPII